MTDLSLTENRTKSTEIGKRYGRLVIIRRAGSTKNKAKNSLWLCQCDCGNQKVITLKRMRSGETVSCGCKGRKNKLKHGMSGTPEHRAWTYMKTRVLNQETKYYHLYGGRGIKICDRWLESFEAFYEDMGKKPSSKHSLDRINNDGDYEPSNCRWATGSEQQLNKSGTRRYEINGDLLTAMEISSKYNLDFQRLRSRITYLRNTGRDVVSGIIDFM